MKKLLLAAAIIGVTSTANAANVSEAECDRYGNVRFVYTATISDELFLKEFFITTQSSDYVSRTAWKEIEATSVFNPQLEWKFNIMDEINVDGKVILKDTRRITIGSYDGGFLYRTYCN